MSAWFAFPSPNHDAVKRTVELWQSMDYKVMVLSEISMRTDADAHVMVADYEGWSKAQNMMMKYLLEADPQMEVAIAGSDDIEPDPDHDPAVVVADMREEFGDDLFGIMQPTGDQYGEIEKCAVCPWIGRGWIERAYEGRGPICEEYYHLYCDQELADVAQMLGVYQKRPDINQFHHHWCRDGEEDRLPALAREKIRDKLEQGKQTYQRRRNAGFPGHQPATS